MLKTFAFATVQITWHITKAATINYKLEMKTQHNPGSLGRKAFIVLFSYLIMLLCKKKKERERETYCYTLGKCCDNLTLGLIGSIKPSTKGLLAFSTSTSYNHTIPHIQSQS